MKTDINLLQKRKAKQYSGQKLGLILLAVFLFAGAAVAGFMLPGSALTAAKLTAASLESDLLSASGTEADIAVLTEEHTERCKQLEALTAIDSTKSDMSEYLKAVESSLPVTANVTRFAAADEMITIEGIAENDEDIAIFCLHLRETAKFREVFLLSSALTVDKTVKFSLEMTLPVTLNSSSVLPEETEETAAAQDPATAEGTTAAQDSETNGEVTP